MKKINLGIVGLGRMGFTHAENIVERIPEAVLVAVCSFVDEELQMAKTKLGVEKTYTSFENMLLDAEIDAVVIASPSGLHGEHIRLAMKKGLHVFCEKPIGVEVEDIEKTIEVVEGYPKQIFHLGFMRRYDKSYQYAKQKVDNGEIGDLTLIRCYGIDPASELENFVKFATNSKSGGLFADMAIHDIDLVRWFSGKEVKRVWAIGKNTTYPELDDLGDLETGAAMMQLEDDTMALLVAGRNAAHGYHVEAELIGSKGMLRIAQEPEKNQVSIFNNQGVVRPTSQHFSERFKEAFFREMKEFILCIQDGKQPGITVYDGLESTVIANACQESVDAGKMIEISK